MRIKQYCGPHWLPITILSLLLIVTFITPSQSSAEVLLRPGAGFVSPTGEVGDNLVKGGLDFYGEVLFGVTEKIYIGGGGHLSVLGGQSVTDDGGSGPQQSTPITDSGARLSIEGIGLIYLAQPDASVRPFLAAGFGFGALGWDYSPEATTVFATSDDVITFVYFAPTAGLEIPLSSNAGIFGSVRYSIVKYGDKTRENWLFELSGGNFLEISAGLSFAL